METAEIRRRWLAFFASKGHTIVPSASLLYDDPNLLFVGAGMVPFVPYFVGQETPPWKRATSVQKCVRTGDIDEVGKTSRHLTFFQMNGNFSFGDYFKADAIMFAWELLTTSQADGGYGLDPERLWATVYLDDDEAADLWLAHSGIPAERIVRRGMADNFWSMGVPGPCGPCSEIFFDRGPEYGREGGPAVDEDRYMEIWNLVFMQNVRGEGTSKDDYPILGDLPAKSVDTGMGLERMASVLQGVDNIYEIDEVYPVLAKAAELTGTQVRRALGAGCGPQRPRRRAPAGGSRPRPGLADAHRRRRHARQRGPRLRPAPDDAPRGALDAAAGFRPAVPAAPVPGEHGADEGVLSPAGDRLLPDLADRVRRGRGLRAHPRLRAPRSWTPRSPRPSPPVRPSWPATRRSRCTTPMASRST